MDNTLVIDGRMILNTNARKELMRGETPEIFARLGDYVSRGHRNVMFGETAAWEVESDLRTYCANPTSVTDLMTRLYDHLERARGEVTGLSKESEFTYLGVAAEYFSEEEFGSGAGQINEGDVRVLAGVVFSHDLAGEQIVVWSTSAGVATGVERLHQAGFNVKRISAIR